MRQSRRAEGQLAIPRAPSSTHFMEASELLHSVSLSQPSLASRGQGETSGPDNNCKYSGRALAGTHVTVCNSALHSPGSTQINKTAPCPELVGDGGRETVFCSISWRAEKNHPTDGDVGP